MRIGIARTGMIADVMAKAMRQVAGLELRAVAGRRREAAEAFARSHGVPGVFPDALTMAEAADVDAIYVATPTAVRASVAMAAARGGKHVLAEKGADSWAAQRS